MTIHTQQFESTHTVCPFTGYEANYRVLDDQRFCMACGEDHESDAGQ